MVRQKCGAGSICDRKTLVCPRIIYYMYVDWKWLRMLLKLHKTIIIMPCCAGKSQQLNSTRVVVFRLNYNHYQTGRITTESCCPSYKRSGTCTYCSCTQNGCSMSRFSYFKVVLNGKATTKFLLIEGTQCKQCSTFKILHLLL